MMESLRRNNDSREAVAAIILALVGMRAGVMMMMIMMMMVMVMEMEISHYSRVSAPLANLKPEVLEQQ